MKTVTFHQINYQAADLLDDFELHKRTSSNIDFFGFRGNDLFVQFNNGSCWLYVIDAELKERLLNPGPGPDGQLLTVGKIIANQVVRKRLSQSLENNCVKMFPRATALMKADYKTNGNVLLASKHEEVFIVNEHDGMVEIENKTTGKRFMVHNTEILKKAI